MSQTQLSNDRLVELVSSWTEEECSTEAEKVGPLIVKNLQHSSCTVFDTIRISNALDKKLFSVMFCNRLRCQIITVTFSQLTSKFDEILSRLPDEENRSINLVSSVIIECLQNAIKIVQCMEKLLQSILCALSQQSDPLNSTGISFIAISVLGVLQNSYLHCKNSERSYGDLFKSTSDALSILFQKTYSLQKALSLILSKLEVPIQDHELIDAADNLNPSFQICDGLLEICRITKSLDNTLLGSSCKLLLRFISRFRHILGGHISLYRYVELLTGNVVENVKYATQLSTGSSHLIMQDDIPTKQAFTHACKLSQFFISSITSVLKDFKHSIDSQVCDVSVTCILDLFEVLKSPMQNENFNDNQLDKNFILGVIGEIDKIVSCLNDFEIFFNSIENLAEDKSQAFVQLQLLISVTKSLSSKNISVWMPSTDCDDDQTSIFFKVFHKYLQVPHNLSGCIYPSVVYADRDWLPLYDTVLIGLCSVISRIPSCQYRPIEKFLFMKIYSHDPCMSTMACDVLVFICKSAPLLCFHYASLLLQFLEKAGENNKPLLSYPCQTTALLLRRILLVMTSNQRREFSLQLSDKGILTKSDVLLTPWELVIRLSKKVNTEMNAWMSNGCKLNLIPLLTQQTCKLKESFHELALGHGQSHSLQSPEFLYALKELFATVLHIWTFIPVEEDNEYFKSLSVRWFIPALTEISGILSKAISQPNVDQIVNNFHQLMKNKDCDTIILLSIAATLPDFVHSASSVFCKDEISIIYSRLLRCSSWRVRNASMRSLEMMVKAPFGGFLVERCAKSPENYPGFEEHLSRTHPLPKNWTSNHIAQQLRENFIISDATKPYSLWKNYERRMVTRLPNIQTQSTPLNESNTCVIKYPLHTADILHNSVVNMKEIINHCLREKCELISKEVVQSLVESKTILDDVIKIVK